MSATWVRVDSNWYEHPKFLQLRHLKAHAAISAYFGGLAWTAAHLQDGYVPAYALAQFGATKPAAKRLVEVGLWHPIDGGYMVNDYAEYQPMRADVEEKRREGRRNAAKRWGNRVGEQVET